MYPKRLVLRNFGPFESLDYDFVHEPIAVIGENLTQDDQISNGSGKSFMSQGLFYGIYGSNLRGREDKKLIQKGCDTAYVSVEIECPIRKRVLKIERELRTKGSSTLRIALIDEKENIEPIIAPTVLEGNRIIANWVEISPEDAKSYYVISKGNYKSFFTASNTEKLALISRFINFSSIDKTKDVIGKEVEGINALKREVELKKSSLEGKALVYNEQLEKLLNYDPEEEKKSQIEEIQNVIKGLEEGNSAYEVKIKRCKEEKKEYEDALQEYLELKEKVQKQLEGLDTESFQAVYKEIDRDLRTQKEEKELQEELERNARKRIRQIESALNSIEVLLAGVITCPKCHHKFLLESDKNVQELEKDKEENSAALIEEKSKKSALEETIEELDEVIREYNSLRCETEQEEKEVIKKQLNIRKKLNEISEAIMEVEMTLKRCDNTVASTKEKISSNKEIISKKKELIISIKQTESKKEDTSTIEAQIKENQKLINIKDKEILVLNDKIFKVQQWETRFKDFKMYLAMEQIKNIQVAANEILKRMGSDLRLMIEGFKKNANGTLKEEITPYVFRDEMENFFFYSGGEQARVEIALIVALQTMINSTKPYGGLQFLLADELLESCDPLGVENIISSMSFLKQPLIIITHVPKLNEEIRQIKIIKENGISRLEE